MDIIQIKSLSFRYGKNSVLDKLDASFTQGKVSIILGRNGSGKSTLFEILANIKKGYDGEVLIGGVQDKLSRISGAKLPKVGFMTQFHQTTFPFSVYDVVMTGRASFTRFAPRSEDHQKVEDVLISFDLWKHKDKPYTKLSGGERQLVLLCRVLVQQPDVLLLDEPTNHLDLHYQVKVLENLRKLAKQGISVICIMHDPNLAFLYGDRFFLMQQRRLHDLSDLGTYRIHQLLEEAYQVELETIMHGGKMLIVPKIQP